MLDFISLFHLQFFFNFQMDELKYFRNLNKSLNHSNFSFAFIFLISLILNEESKLIKIKQKSSKFEVPIQIIMHIDHLIVFNDIFDLIKQVNYPSTSMIKQDKLDFQFKNVDLLFFYQKCYCRNSCFYEYLIFINLRTNIYSLKQASCNRIQIYLFILLIYMTQVCCFISLSNPFTTSSTWNKVNF